MLVLDYIYFWQFMIHLANIYIIFNETFFIICLKKEKGKKFNTLQQILTTGKFIEINF